MTRVPFLSLDDLIRAKEASGRPQDLADLDRLRRVRRLQRGSANPDSGAE